MTTPVERYDTNQFGLMIQNLNPNKAFSISWGIGGGEEDGPQFYFFKDVLEIINMLMREYQTPFVLSTGNEDAYTRDNAVLQFNDNALEIRVISFKNEGTLYKFFRNDVYQYLKQSLSQNTIPWTTYSQM